MTGSKNTRRKSKRSKSVAHRAEPESHESAHTQESSHSHGHTHSGSEPIVREDHGVPSKPLDYGYKRCQYRGIWNPCYCLCCKDSLKCGCIVFGALTIVAVLPLLGNLGYSAYMWTNHQSTNPYKTYLILSIVLYTVSIICFLVEGIISLVSVLKRMKTCIYAYCIIGIVVWLLMQLLVVIVLLIWWNPDTGKPGASDKAATPEQETFKEKNPTAPYDLYAAIPFLFFLILFMWPYSIVTHAVLWKRHVELGSGDMVRDDGV